MDDSKVVLLTELWYYFRMVIYGNQEFT